MNEVRSFVEGGLKDLSVSAHLVPLGRQCRAPKHVIYIVDRRAQQPFSALQGSERTRVFWAVTSTRWPSTRWARDHSLPRRVLAGRADGRGPAAAEEDPRPRLVDGRRRKDEQVAGQRRRSAQAGCRYRRRCGALLRAARDPARRRRRFSHDALLNRYNSELANDLGNLLNRTLAMVEKFSGSPSARQSTRATICAGATRGGCRPTTRRAGSRDGRAAAAAGLGSAVRAGARGQHHLEQQAPFTRVSRPTRRVRRTSFTTCSELLRWLA